MTEILLKVALSTITPYPIRFLKMETPNTTYCMYILISFIDGGETGVPGEYHRLQKQ
jgi:hypothetical protein